MKKTLSFLLAILFLIGPVFSHSGRTDENGGHNGPDGYHYHHGYPAHQHVDGVCPYDFDNRIGQSSGTSGNSSSSSSVDRNSSVKSTQESKTKLPAFLLISSFTALVLVAIYTRNRIAAKRYEEEQRRIFEEEKQRYTKLYGGKSPEELVGMPDGVEIGPDDLPKVTGADGWGSLFTVYIAPQGYAFHTQRGCSNATVRIHIWKLMSHSGELYRAPCTRCSLFAEVPDLKWYAEYLKIKAIKEKYGID